MRAASVFSNFSATMLQGRGMGHTGPGVQALLHLRCRFTKEERMKDLKGLFGPDSILWVNLTIITGASHSRHRASWTDMHLCIVQRAGSGLREHCTGSGNCRGRLPARTPTAYSSTPKGLLWHRTSRQRSLARDVQVQCPVYAAAGAGGSSASGAPPPDTFPFPLDFPFFFGSAGWSVFWGSLDAADEGAWDDRFAPSFLFFSERLS